MTKTITAFFDTLAEAERAARDLATKVGGVRGGVYDAKRSGDLCRLSIPGEDMAAYNEGIRRGGAILHAQVPDHQFDAAADALEAAGAADIDEREAAWRKEGWTGGVSQATGGTAQFGASSSAATTGTAQTGGEERIPIVEERRSIGKRETAHGRVRIRSYVVEAPVQEQVALREERVRIERNPVDRPIAAGDDAFRERTIEHLRKPPRRRWSPRRRASPRRWWCASSPRSGPRRFRTVRRTEVEVEDERGRTGTTERPDEGLTEHVRDGAGRATRPARWRTSLNIGRGHSALRSGNADPVPVGAPAALGS